MTLFPNHAFEIAHDIESTNTTSENKNRNSVDCPFLPNMDSTTDTLTDAFIGSQSSIELEIKNRHIGNDGIFQLTTVLEQNKIITALNLCENEIGDAGAESLAHFLKDNDSLLKLNLANNEIGQKGISALLRSLENHDSIKKLDLSGNDLSSGCPQLASFLYKNSSLTSLTLSNCCIQNEGLFQLNPAFKENKSLLKMNLAQNKLSRDSIEDLLLALKESAVIQKLNFSGINLGALGATKIASFLRENQTLKTLLLRDCHLGPKGGDSLGDAIEKKKSLRHLDLNGNKIGIDACYKIMTVFLSKNKKQNNKAANTGRLRSFTFLDDINVNSVWLSDGSTMLIRASAVGNTNAVEWLLKYKDIQINLKDKNGYTAFQHAQYNKHQGVIDLLQAHFNPWLYRLVELAHKSDTFDVLDMIESPEGNINAAGLDGATVLHHAAAHSNRYFLQLLLCQEGVNKDVKDLEGYSPYEWAEYNNREPPILELLRKDPKMEENDIIEQKNDEDKTKLLQSSLTSSAFMAKSTTSIPIEECTEINDFTFTEDEDSVIGEGSFGKVYKGVDQRSQRLVAIKKIPGNIFWQENKEEINLMCMASNVEDRDLFRCFFDNVNDIGYVIMPFHGHTDMHSLLEEKLYEQHDQEFSWELEVAQLIHASAVELSNVHKRRIIHRDIKQENMIVSGKGMHKTVKLIDFGLSLKLKRGADLFAELYELRYCGTVGFMAPEILQRHVGVKMVCAAQLMAGDVYALGKVMEGFLMQRFLDKYKSNNNCDDDENDDHNNSVYNSNSKNSYSNNNKVDSFENTLQHCKKLFSKEIVETLEKLSAKDWRDRMLLDGEDGLIATLASFLANPGRIRRANAVPSKDSKHVRRISSSLF